MNILMVLTSHDQLGDTGTKTGFWLEESAAPYYVFKGAGARITLASPNGGQLPLDPSSDAEGAQTDAIKHPKGDDWASFVVTDGKLATGRNPASSEEAARKLLALL